MRSGLSSSVKKIFLKGGIYGFLRTVLPNRKAAIFRYHSLADPQSNSYVSPAITLTPQQFEHQVRYFSANYKVLSLDEVVDHLRQGIRFPSNSVAFTFDDGYADNFAAAQILGKYSANGTFFITTDPMGRESRFWLVEVIYMILETSKEKLTIGLGNDRQKFILGDKTSRWRGIRKIIGLVKSNNKKFREDILNQISDQLGTESTFREIDDLMLTWEQVKEMLRMGMVIGSHTLTHLNLPNADPADALREISESKKVLENKLQSDIRHFSYPNSGPYDYYNDAVRKLVIDAGYDSSCTSKQGFVDSNSDYFALERIRTNPQLEEIVHSIEWDRIFSSQL